MLSSISAANASTLFSIGELRASWVFSPGSVLFCAMRFYLAMAAVAMALAASR